MIMNAASPRLAAALLAGLLLLAPLTAAPVGWRTDGTGVYPNAEAPTAWAEGKNVLWKTKLPGRSFGSPILVGEQLFVVSDPAELICINAGDGKVLWQRSHALEDLYDAETAAKVTAEFKRLKTERDRLRREQDRAKNDPEKKAEIKKQLDAVESDYKQHAAKYPVPPAISGDQGSTNSAATPVSDGKTVYALFGNGIACAYAVNGDKRWVKFVESSEIVFGHSSSPVLIDGKVLVHLKDLVALDATNGEEAWRVRLSAQHATPLPTKVGDTAVVVHPSGAVVRVADGKVLLRSGYLSSSECTAVVQDGIIYTTHGKARALRLVAAGAEAVKPEQLWEARLTNGRRTPSAGLHDGLLYTATTDGKMDVLDAKTGELVYQRDLGIGEVYCSITVAGKYLFAGSTKGAAVLFEPGKEYREVSRNQIEGFGSNPVFSGRRMYLRTKQYLYCIGK
jgi:outer membrane protein assembly factor BamB